MSLDEEVKILSDRLQKLTEELNNVGKRPENYGRLLSGETALLVCDIQVDISLGDAGNGILNTSSNTSSAILSVCNIQKGVSILLWLVMHVMKPQQ